MQRNVLVAAAVISAALLAGCDNAPTKIDGAPEPAGVGAASPSVAGAPSGGPSASATASPTATATVAATRESNDLVLGPDGYKDLALGMTVAEALKTGELVKNPDGYANRDGCNTQYRLKAAATGHGVVFFNGGRGLVSIFGSPAFRTPEGITSGSTVAKVAKTYPGWKRVTGPEADGRGWAPVPGDSDVVYNITYRDNKVVQIALQMRNQACYE